MIATKIIPPRLKSNRVTRTRLIERFNADSQENVVLLSAPAGFGKTTLLSEWADRNKTGLAWVSLDEGDNDPGLFWSYVGAALVRAEVGVTPHAMGALTAVSEISIEHALSPLLAELAVARPPITLILDDYHTISSGRIHASIAFFLEHVPHGVRVVFGSRAEVPFPTARLRARGRLLEINASGLSFTEAEAADLFRSAVPTALSETGLEQIMRETQGWPMGLRAAAMALNHARPPEEVERNATLAPYSPEVFRREVFADQPPAILSFLVRTSFLNRLNPSLCDFVLGTCDSAEVLTQLEGSDAFIASFDDAQPWYRLHPLCAQILREEFDLLEPPVRAELHRRAAEWLSERGQWESAIRHALDGEDWSNAIELIARLGRFNVPTNRPETILSWLSRIPRESLIREPGACVQLARAMMFGNLHSDYEALLQIAEAGVAVSGDAGLAASVYSVRSQAECFRGNQDRAIALADSGIELLPETETLNRGVLRQIQAVSFMLSDRITEAESATMQAFQKSLDAGNGLTACLALGMRSFINLRRGRLPSAVRYLTQAQKLANSSGLPGLYILPFYRSRIEIESLRLEAAWEALQAAETTFDRTGNRIFMAGVYLCQARLRWMRGRSEEAKECLSISEEADRSMGSIKDVFDARTLRTKIAIEQRDWVQVERLVSSASVPQGYENRTTHWRARACLALEKGDRASAQGSVRAILELAKQAASSGLGIDAMSCYIAAAGLEVRLGAHSSALAHTMRAVRMGSVGRVLGPFWEERHGLRPILDEARLDPTHGSFVNELSHRLYLGQEPSLDLATVLSAKEFEVVRLLSQGHSNEAIAEIANISQNTVKTHLKHIYAKLNVSNRTQAVAAARAHGQL